MLDVGCGYGGQLAVALENHPFSKVVGWTISSNQANKGQQLLAPFDKELWEVREGDYREENRIFDHITSTGMISHVGPRGLAPYVRNIRKHIKKGGRYVHHSLMRAYNPKSLYSFVGPSFNKKYVWPGFHWFSFAEHIKALEENGFIVTKAVNLAPHYAKTTAAWYERMRAHDAIMKENLGESTYRAWQIYLAPTSHSFGQNRTHVYRCYCVAR